MNQGTDFNKMVSVSQAGKMQIKEIRSLKLRSKIQKHSKMYKVLTNLQNKLTGSPGQNVPSASHTSLSRGPQHVRHPRKTPPPASCWKQLGSH